MRIITDELLKRANNACGEDGGPELVDLINDLVDKIEDLTTERDRLREAVDDALYAWDSHKEGGYPMEGWWVSGARAAHKGE